MKTRIFFLCLTCLFANAFASEKIIWKGEVSSSGQPTAPITLVTHKQYQIRAQGYVNLGKWIRNTEELANDACYEFSQSGTTDKMEALRNSNDISVCDGKYHPDHAYQSEPFTATQNRIHFWIHDTNYDDNSGSFKVQVVELDK